MAKIEVKVQFTFTLPIDESFLHHKTDAERKAKEAFVLELLRHRDISAGRAAKLLNISRWDLSDLMSVAGISPFAELTHEALDTEVETALKVLNRKENTDDTPYHETAHKN